MLKRLVFILIVISFIICGCTNTADNEKNAQNVKFEHISIDNSNSNSKNVGTAPEIEIPEHSDLYIEGRKPEIILKYFDEVVLNMEYSDGKGNVNLVQKWLSPIYYKLHGSYTQADKSILENLFEQLNAIEGFPGIYAATDEFPENLSIHFYNQIEFTEVFHALVNDEDVYGAAKYDYDIETNEIHTANIGYRTDIRQFTRDSILVEEIINVLGISDTELRKDSVVYQNSNANKELSDVDILILKILYSPYIECGMNYDSCAEVIQRIYY